MNTETEGFLKSVCRNFHWLATAVLLLALPPLARKTGIPLRFYWPGIFILWRELALASILLAAFLYVLSSPRAFAEKIRHTGPPAPFPKRQLAGIFGPMAYFFSAFLIVLSYNDIIAALRFDGRADPMLSRMDSWLLRGQSVLQWSHWLLGHHPGFFKPIEFVYLILFCVIGACVVTVGADEGYAQGFKMVGAIMTAYYISLLLFYIVPAAGPYLADNASVWPRDSQVYFLEMTAGVELPQFVHGLRPSWIGTDYFLAFPCMHLVQPLIMLWFTRKRGAFAWMLGSYTALLIPCILLLEEHYVVDLIAAVPVAALSVFLVQG